MGTFLSPLVPVSLPRHWHPLPTDRGLKSTATVLDRDAVEDTHGKGELDSSFRKLLLRAHRLVFVLR